MSMINIIDFNFNFIFTTISTGASGTAVLILVAQGPSNLCSTVVATAAINTAQIKPIIQFKNPNIIDNANGTAVAVNPAIKSKLKSKQYL